MADPKEPHRTVSRVRDQAILKDELVMPASNCHPPSKMDQPALGVPASMPTNGGRLLVEGTPTDSTGIVLSETALLVIQGFPKDWHVAGDTKTARMSQIGQAMPPQLSHAIATSIVAWFDNLSLREPGEAA
jgi:site-specific DNA-cytosine methylase